MTCGEQRLQPCRRHSHGKTIAPHQRAHHDMLSLWRRRRMLQRRRALPVWRRGVRATGMRGSTTGRAGRLCGRWRRCQQRAAVCNVASSPSGNRSAADVSSSCSLSLVLRSNRSDNVQLRRVSKSKLEATERPSVRRCFQARRVLRRVRSVHATKAACAPVVVSASAPPPAIPASREAASVSQATSRPAARRDDHRTTAAARICVSALLSGPTGWPVSITTNDRSMAMRRAALRGCLS